MPALRFRKRLLDRLVRSASSAGEFGLALLMTAGVAHCGGSTQTKTGEGTTDGAADHQLAVEAAQEGGAVIEAAGGDGSPYPVVEAPAPAPDAGSDAPGPTGEAATPAPDAGSDAYMSPWVEAPLAPPN